MSSITNTCCEMFFSFCHNGLKTKRRNSYGSTKEKQLLVINYSE